MINNRQEQILQELIKSHVLITADYLAVLLSVTTRTIRSDLTFINDILSNNGARISKGDYKQIKLIIENEADFNKFISTFINAYQSLPVEPEDRLHYIIRKFLLSTDYIKIDDLAEEIIVSRSTLQKDLKDVKVILNKFNLSFEKRPNYGLILIGNERHIRNAMSELLFRRTAVSIVDTNSQSWLLEGCQMETIQEIVLFNLKKFDFNLSDIALNNLVVHITIACRRIQSQQYAQLGSIDNSDIIEKKEYEVANSIISDIGMKLGYEFPQIEVTYVTMHLLGTKLFLDSEKKQPLSEFDQKITDVVNQVIRIVSRKLGLNVANDNELYAGITIHLKPAIHRFKHKMNIRNPMLEAIKVHHPLAFEASVMASKIIEQHFDIVVNEDEIGYIALHFGAAIERARMEVKPIRTLIVCTTGIGSSQLLLYKIKAKFSKQLSIIAATELHNLPTFSQQDIDLIISTVPLPESVMIPHVVVSDILGDTDFSIIQQYIDKKDTSIVKKYLQKDLIYLQLDLNSPEEVIRFLCDELLHKKKVDVDIFESVLEREKAAPTSFGNYVALPHPILPITEETFWTLATLKYPVNWNDKKVQLICLLNVAKEVNQSLDPMYKTLISIIDNPNIVQKIIKCKSKEDVFRILENV